MNRLAEAARRWLRRMAAVVMPERCAACGRRLAAGERAVCTDCTLTMPYTRFAAREGNPVERIFIGRFPLGRASAYILYAHGNMASRLVIEMKYHHRTDVAVEMGRRAARELLAAGFFEGVSAIVPVPLSRKRMRHRGYNQSELIAQGLSEVSGVKVDGSLLSRVVDNSTQTRRSTAERLTNVAGIFRAMRPEAVDGRHLLLVDDVVTTGATLTACADALAEAGALRISVFALAAASSVARW